MLAVTSIDWTKIILGALAAFSNVTVVALGLVIRSHLKTPSGPTVGTQTEQANALSALAVAYLSTLMERQGVPKPDVHDAIVKAEEAAKPLINGHELPKSKETGGTG